MASILFDLDGTLVDSRAAIFASLHHVQRQWGLPCAPTDSLQWGLGPPLDDIMRRLLNSCDEAQIARAVAVYREHHPSVCVTHAAVYGGIRDALRGLADLGHQLFVATSKLGTVADLVLEHFKLRACFEGVYGSELDGRLSRKVDVIRHVLCTHQLDVTTTVMVGDREHDVLGARANCIRAIAVTYGYGSLEELRGAGPDAMCERPEQLICLMQQNR